MKRKLLGFQTGAGLQSKVKNLIRLGVFIRCATVIPGVLFVCHTCDTPRCIEDSHHFLGTPLSNMIDKTNKGRWRGGRPPKISDDAVRDMRTKRVTAREFGEIYGMRRASVREIQCGKRRKHVK